MRDVESTGPGREPGGPYHARVDPAPRPDDGPVREDSHGRRMGRRAWFAVAAALGVLAVDGPAWVAGAAAGRVAASWWLAPLFGIAPFFDGRTTIASSALLIAVGWAVARWGRLGPVAAGLGSVSVLLAAAAIDVVAGPDSAALLGLELFFCLVLAAPAVVGAIAGKRPPPAVGSGPS